MKLHGSIKRSSSSNKNWVILGACSATDWTLRMSSKSHTSKLRVNPFTRSRLLVSANSWTSCKRACENAGLVSVE